MAATAATSFLSPLAPPRSHSNFHSTSTHKPKKTLFNYYSYYSNSCYYFPGAQNSNSSYPPPISYLTLSLPLSKSNPNYALINPLGKPRNCRGLASAASEDAAVSAESAAEQIVSTTSGGDDGVSNIISVLLFVAFVGLSILTIGVIYIGVTDFLQKREKEKFEKQEAENNKKKKGGKKDRIRTRAGPRGFGQKIDEDDD